MPIDLLWSEKSDNIAPLSLVITDKSTQTLAAHFATMLVASDETFSLLLKNNTFKTLFLRLWGENLEDKKQCIRAQKTIFNYLSSAPHMAEAMLFYLYKLKEAQMLHEEIITHVQGLASADLEQKSKPLHVKIPADFDFHAIKKALMEIGLCVKKDILEPSYLKNQLQESENKLEKAKFSVGITGVMNAGKSTMLNALLGREILGTSTVPETANLTIISHSNTPTAKVHFWSTHEWELIEKSAQTSQPMSKFVNETKTLIANDWEKLITDDGYSESIEPKDLAKFTSATISKGRCNIVKSVELGLDIVFGGEGVSIVDTPGLDDPIIQREEITKSYLANCDAMVHLMNAGQSATQKDVDFIIDALTYQRISHLVLVITRIDGIDDVSLQEVMEYTKKSITNRLKALDKPHLVDSILAKISIFPVTGLYALMHKIGKEEEAIKNGWSIEKTGIKALEEHLKNLLFGGERAHIMLQGASKTMLHVLEKQEEILENEKLLLSQNADELMQKSKALHVKQTNLKNQIQTAQSEANEILFASKEHLYTMEKVAKGRLARLQTQIGERLADDVRYSIKKTKKYPNASRLEAIVATAMADGLVDLVREYRFGLFEYMQKQIAPFIRKYGEILGQLNYEFDPKAYQEEAAKSGILSTNYSLLAQNTQQAILSQKMKNASVGLENARHVILKGFESIESRVLPLLYQSGQKMALEAHECIQKPIEQAMQKIQQESESLEAVLLHVKQDRTSVKLRIENINEKMEQIKVYKDQIISCMEVA